MRRELGGGVVLFPGGHGATPLATTGSRHGETDGTPYPEAL